MSIHIWKETSVTPTTKQVNLRVLDSPDPHFIAFSARCVVADAAAGNFTASVRYEDEAHQIHQIDLSPITLADITESGGGISNVGPELASDHYFPNLNPPTDSGTGGDVHGLFVLDLTRGGSAGTSKITYELVIEQFDGSPAVVYH